MNARAITLALAILASDAALAWTVSEDNLGRIIVRNGRMDDPATDKIVVEDRKSGEKLAKKLNKLEEKDKKEGPEGRD